MRVSGIWDTSLDQTGRDWGPLGWAEMARDSVGPGTIGGDLGQSVARAHRLQTRVVHKTGRL